MSFALYNWIVVYEDGHTELIKSECPPNDYELEDGFHVIAIIRNGY